ncbi:tetratricopeptide repeat protein [Streptomyces rapamycinicus]|uniref:Tetratricopeptide repeat protein n=2 Tax=Streptomyces rapamycinicus TaxID=1226757 RepID=A0A3L8RBU6_STRRN|nr:tetratricopeptide repeat protein [Streptomyces rapamycinicus]MBB4789226.1 TPR repeat protein [Streptomyces rapamycinicus]RLV77195.1 hypothetical protein D3C57_102460 [Streptomyces rapamycinicus NRRL 5491]UTO67319.1 tetratricopeptide repeat protein [Streptomyces rapamycinicus]UTP35276.1 tetratricopeptide repeat protein [Streptomyces rapamycinicus NRRL 5491]
MGSNEISGGCFGAAVQAGNLENLTITSSCANPPPFPEDPGNWPLAGEWEALVAGTHPSRPGAGGGDGDVPPYIARDADERIRRRVAEAERHGGMVLVVGDSTAGKTRAAFEAVRAVLPVYRVCAPSADNDLTGVPLSIERGGSRCVVWLDDLERYLRPGGLQIDVLAALTRLRVPVVATMRLKPFESFSAARDHGSGAQLLRAAEVIDLDRLWSEGELSRAERCDDPRILDALTHHGMYGVAEYLAAGPSLLREWRRAGPGNGHARGAALVRAAVDLTRCGLRGPYPRALLEDAHQWYLPAEGAISRLESVDTAFDWASEVRHGVTSLLLPAGTEKWLAFDYLVDHADTEIPDQVWEAALAHTDADADRWVIARNAQDVAPQAAEEAWRPLADAGNPYAANDLALLLGELGRAQEAESLYRQALGKGHLDAANNLAVLLEREGRVDEAEALYRSALRGGDPYAALNLGDLLERADRLAEAAALYRRALNNGSKHAAHALATLAQKMGSLEEAVSLYRVAIDLGDPYAAEDLAELLIFLGRPREAEECRARPPGPGGEAHG